MFIKICLYLQHCQHPFQHLFLYLDLDLDLDLGSDLDLKPVIRTLFTLRPTLRHAPKPLPTDVDGLEIMEMAKTKPIPKMHGTSGITG